MNDANIQRNAAAKGIAPPADEEAWSKTVTAVVAGQIKFWRDQRNLSANELSKRTAELGSEVPRSVIANLETGRRDSISVDELLILGAALDVPPLLLLTPVGRTKTMRVLPSVDSTPWFARGWIIGARLVEYAGASAQRWRESRRAVALYDVHRTLLQQYAQIQTRIRRVADQAQLTSGTGAGQSEQQQRYLQALVNDLAQSLHTLRMHRKTIESEGLLVPELPPALMTLLREVNLPEDQAVADDWGVSLADQAAADEVLYIVRQAQSGRTEESD
jgi:transcriptional regulator with XRE-family HTH domain